MGCVIKIGNQSVPETDFLNHLNKIININKLFEENPEFSSQIYEALGFKTNITQDNKTNISLIKEYFRPALTKEFNRPQQFADFGYTLKSTYADEIGTILRSFAENSISKEEFGDRILGVLEEQEFTSDETKDKIFHRELRTLAYTVLSRDLILNNKENILKNILKKDSSNIFELIRVDADNNKFVIRTDYGTSGIGFNSQTNEIWENDNRSMLNTNVNQITLQQKQQAQQLYSQYLDTIFPKNTIVYRGSEKGRTDFQTRGFFTDKLSYAKEYAFDKGFVSKSGKEIVNTFLINTSNVKNVGEMNTEYVKNELQDLVLKGVDKGRTKESGNVYATTSKNLHELGSKQDIEGFKKFVSGKPITEPTVSKEINDIDNYKGTGISKEEWDSLSTKEKEVLLWQKKNCK